MALQTRYRTEEWESFFIKAGISANSVKNYATKFAREKPTKENLQLMDRAMLKELGITAMGDALSILKQAKEPLYPDHLCQGTICQASPNPLRNDP